MDINFRKIISRLCFSVMFSCTVTYPYANEPCGTELSDAQIGRWLEHSVISVYTEAEILGLTDTFISHLEANVQGLNKQPDLLPSPDTFTPEQIFYPAGNVGFTKKFMEFPIG